MTTFDRATDRGFREIADAAPVIVMYSGLDGSALFVNRAWLEFCGTTLQQSLGDGWIEACHRDDRELVGEAYWKAFQERVPFSVEFRMRRLDLSGF